MAFKLAELYTEIKVRDTEAKRGLANIRRLAEGATRGLEAVARVGKYAFAAIGAAAGVSIYNAAQQEKAEAKLEAVLKATGYAAGFSADQLKKQASELQELTGTGDDAIISTQAVLATFKEIRGDQFKQATTAILDMSAVLDQDAKQGAIQLGKALNDPIRGITALSRVGVSFTEEQREQIRVMQEAGDIAGAQGIILKELQSEFGGAAEAAGNTFAGQVNKLKGQLGDLSEVIGKPLIQALSGAIDKIREWLPSMEEMQHIVAIVAENIRRWAIFWVDAFARAYVAIANWKDYTKKIMIDAALFIIDKALDIAHFFETDLPSAFMVMGRNIWNIMKEVGSNIGTILYNWNDNVARAMESIWNLIKGEDANFVWKPLTDGLKFNIEKWKGLTKRGTSEIEKTLGAESDRIGKELASKSGNLMQSWLKALGLGGPITFDSLFGGGGGGPLPAPPPPAGAGAAAGGSGGIGTLLKNTFEQGGREMAKAFSGMIGLQDFGNRIQEALLAPDESVKIQQKLLQKQQEANAIAKEIRDNMVAPLSLGI